MRRLLWPGIVFLSVSWLFFMPIFNIPDYNTGIIFLIIGIFFCITAFHKENLKELDKKYLIILLPLIFLIFILPLPYSLGPILLIISTLLYAVLKIFNKQKHNWAILGISFSGVVLSIQTLCFPFYSVFVSHGHRVDILSSIIASIGGFFGLKTSVSNGILFVQSYTNTWPVTTTWEKLGFYPWFNIFLAALLVLFFLKGYKKFAKYLALFLFLSFTYLIFRYILIIFIFIQNEDFSTFWNQMLLAFSFLPFIIILAKFIPINKIKLDLNNFSKINFKKKQIAALLLFFIFMFSLVGAFNFHDPGTKKQGRVLIDEYHSEWEDTTQEMDKEWYGLISTYNYYSLAEWLNYYYTVDRNIDEQLTLDLLNNYDVLILKCPTDLYSAKEISDIVEFVENGGGLYLIGDHTNVFGMNFYLNKISERFGIKFLTDSTYDLNTGLTSTYIPSPLFKHPVMQNVEQFEFLTSCTIEAPITSENVIIGNILLGEPGTYATQNFFREDINTPDVEYGLLMQVAAVKHGKGRVLAFTDSTCFSNFCVFMDGYTDFNLGVIDYLNRENTYSYVNTILMIISIFSLAASIYIMRKNQKTQIIFIFLLAAIIAISSATPVFSHINSSNYQLPKPHSDYTKICFEEEHSSISIEQTPETLDSYSTFFVWTQRVGKIPSFEKTLDDAIDKGDVVVIINPVTSFNSDELNQIKQFINQGGQVLLMDSIINIGSTSKQILGEFNIQINYGGFDLSLITPDYADELMQSNQNNISIGNITKTYLSITGISEEFVTQYNQTTIATVEEGQGKLILVIDSYVFSDVVMGATFTEPDEELREIYDLEYYIFEELLQK